MCGPMNCYSFAGWLKLKSLVYIKKQNQQEIFCITDMTDYN